MSGFCNGKYTLSRQGVTSSLLVSEKKEIFSIESIFPSLNGNGCFSFNVCFPGPIKLSPFFCQHGVASHPNPSHALYQTFSLSLSLSAFSFFFSRIFLLLLLFPSQSDTHSFHFAADLKPECVLVPEGEYSFLKDRYTADRTVYVTFKHRKSEHTGKIVYDYILDPPFCVTCCEQRCRSMASRQMEDLQSWRMI